MDIETKAYYQMIFKLRLKADINTSPLFLQRQRDIQRPSLCCLEQIIPPAERAELNLKAKMGSCVTLIMYFLKTLFILCIYF